MQEVSNVLTSAGYRVYAADNAAKQYGIIQEAISAAQEAAQEAISAAQEAAQEAISAAQEAAQHYAGAVYLTQAEYDALTPQQKMDATKVYFIEIEEESESE
jgi:vacuolar-type H+-ATPase subunit H